MTVSTTSNRNSGTGDGATTAFTFTFACQQTSDIDVYKDGVLQGSGYTAAINSNGVGGTVTFTTAPAAAVAILIVRSVDLTQTSDLAVEGNMPESTLEDMADKNVMMAQQLSERLDRAAVLPITSSASAALPTPEALQCLRWNSGATAIENATSAEILAELTAVGNGNVIGPASSTDKRLAQFDGTTGRLLKDGPAIGNAGEFLQSAGAGADPAFSKLALTGIVNGRLTLTTATPFVTSVTAATTLYFTPYNGNMIALYNGTKWEVISFSEISIAVPATTNQMYDVFVYNNSGTATLELVAWTNDTTRATALALQDGVLSKTGALTRRFLGCMRTTGVSGQTEVSSSRKLVANYYNRKPCFLAAQDGTNSWTTTTATFHSANGSTTIGTARVDFIIPFADQLVEAETKDVFTHSSTTLVSGGHSGIGLDSVTVNSAQLTDLGSAISSGTVGTSYGQCSAKYKGYPAVGYHFLQHLVAAVASGTTTFYGADGGALHLSGLLAEIAA